MMDNGLIFCEVRWLYVNINDTINYPALDTAASLRKSFDLWAMFFIYIDNLKTHFFKNKKLVFFENYKLYSIHTSLLITVWIVVENFVKKSGQKIWILVTCLAYTAILIFQIFCQQFIFLVLHNFSRLFVYYFSIILLTLHVVNSLLITYAINYQSIFKVVNNLLITNNETLITQKSSIFEKSFQLY